MNKEVFPPLFVLLCAFAASVLPVKTNFESGKRLGNDTAVRCQQTCELLRTPSNEDGVDIGDNDRISSCVKKCLDEADRTTTHIASEVQPTNKTEPDWCMYDRNGWKPKAEGEIIPGDAEDINVIFYRQNSVWGAKITWSLPKGVKLSDHWGGYMALWSSYDSVIVSCRAVDKSKTEFHIEDGDGWRYPEELYIAVVGVPTIVSGHSLMSFSPVIDDRHLDWEPLPTVWIARDSKKDKWLLMGSISLCFAVLCLIAAFFTWFTKSNRKRTVCKSNFAELVIANDGSARKQLSNSPVDAV